MQAFFADMVGTTVTPAHCFDSAELTDLTPDLDTATAVHDVAEHASEATASALMTPKCGLVHDMITQASEAAPTAMVWCGVGP